MDSRETIAALASGSGRAGVAVLRISGPEAGAALKALGGPLPKPRYAARRKLKDEAGALIDDALVVWFPSPASFTGEDVAELHLHGGAAVIEAALAACLAIPGIRLARPGEFTRRAFENGKLDLTEAEGLGDLIDAETEGQRRQALRQMEGALGGLYEGWRTRLIEAMALLEAAIDFPDEDLPEDLAARVGPLIAALQGELDAHLAEGWRGERVRDGFRIAILGPPNAGKSSLLNALAGREAAIVSDIPGTTRDVVEVRLVLAGFPVWLADTAGLREAADVIEAEGVRRALERAEAADLRLALLEPGQALPSALMVTLRPGDIVLGAKADLAPLERFQVGAFEALPVSSKSGAGIAELEALLAERVQAALGAQEVPALTRVRHRQLVADAAVALAGAQCSLIAGPEYTAEDLRRAADALGRLTGRIDVEHLLDQIFSSFCIGK